MALKIEGKKWTVEDAEICGMCDREQRLITISPRLTPKQRMGAMLHELLHVALPNLDEDTVGSVECILQEGLWADGWRRKPRKPRQK